VRLVGFIIRTFISLYPWFVPITERRKIEII